MGQTEPPVVELPKSVTKPFGHLDLSLTAGTTGIGFDLAAPLTNSVQLRLGAAAMPHFNYDMHFGVQVGDDPEKSASKFERLSGLLEGFTGYKVDDDVRMIGQPSFYHMNLMVDVMPFRNKNWHLTAGFYLGPEKFGKAFNSTEDMASLVAVGIYNNLYDRVAKSDIINDPFYFYMHSMGDVLRDIDLLKTLGFNVDDYEILDNYGLDPDNNPIKSAYERIYNYGRMGIHVGDFDHDIYYDEDVLYGEDVVYKDDVWDDDYENIIHYKGEVIHKANDPNDPLHCKGDLKHSKGDPYMMTPDETSMVKANFLVDNFRPYLGFGYGGNLSKKDDRWKISFDCGAMFWGGKPRIVTHEGIDLCRDVTNISGDVGRYVRFFKKFWAYPVLSVRITRRLF